MKEILCTQLNDFFNREITNLLASQKENQKIFSKLDEVIAKLKQITELLELPELDATKQHKLTIETKRLLISLSELMSYENISEATKICTELQEELNNDPKNKPSLTEKTKKIKDIVVGCKTKINESEKTNKNLARKTLQDNVSELINHCEEDKLTKLNASMELLKTTLINIPNKDEQLSSLKGTINHTLTIFNNTAAETQKAIKEIIENTAVNIVGDIQANLNEIKTQKDQVEDVSNEETTIAFLVKPENIVTLLTFALCSIILFTLLRTLFIGSYTEKVPQQKIESVTTDSNKGLDKNEINRLIKSELASQLPKPITLPENISLINNDELTKATNVISAYCELAHNVETIKKQLDNDSKPMSLLQAIGQIDDKKILAIQEYIKKDLPIAKMPLKETPKAADSQNEIKNLENTISDLRTKIGSQNTEIDQLKNSSKQTKSEVSESSQHPTAIIIPIEKTFSPNKPIFDNLIAHLKNDLSKNKITNARIFWESNAQIEEYTDETKANMMQRNWDGGVSEPEMTTAKNVLEKMEFKKCEIIYILGPNSTVVPKIETAMYLNGNKCSIINIRTSDKLNTRFLNSWLEVAKINGGAFRMVDALNNNPTDIIKEITNIAQNK
jgi:hypothetical protein